MAEVKDAPPRVAVIGLGLAGVGALKNLREVGLNAVGFERNDYVGGLWRWTAEARQTSVLRNTVANITRQRNCYTDFRFPDDAPDYPTAEQIARYIDDYADHFRLRPHCRLETTVERITRSADGLGWMVRSKGVTSAALEEQFDKVLIATGTYSKPFTPTIEGAEQFHGQALHSQAFKDPNEYAGKRVVVVGLSNTGGDIAVELAKVASKVYLCHRSGARIMQRRSKKGTPADHTLSRRLSTLGLSFARALPWLAGKMGAVALERRMKAHPAYKDDWGLLPAGPIPHATPVMNDHLLDLFATGAVVSAGGIRRFCADGTTVELRDGTTLAHVDAVVCATGYRYDTSVLAGDPDADPTAAPTPEWDGAEHSNGVAYPRLYMGLFAPAFPGSLAFLGAYRGASASAFTGFDLKSQAVAQVWAGAYPLPPRAEIERWCDRQYAYMLGQVSIWRIHKPGLPPGELEKWLNEVTGNGVNEMLGWGWRAWRFWWSDRKLYGTVMDGLDTAFVYRLFEGRRPKWEGARDAILRTNRKAG